MTDFRYKKLAIYKTGQKVSLRSFIGAQKYIIEAFSSTVNYSRATLVEDSANINMTASEESPERFRGGSTAHGLQESLFNSPDSLALDRSRSIQVQMESSLEKLREKFLTSQTKIKSEQIELNNLEMAVEKKKKTIYQLQELQNNLQDSLNDFIKRFEDELQAQEHDESVQ